MWERGVDDLSKLKCIDLPLLATAQNSIIH